MDIMGTIIAGFIGLACWAGFIYMAMSLGSVFIVISVVLGIAGVYWLFTDL